MRRGCRRRCPSARSSSRRSRSGRETYRRRRGTCRRHRAASALERQHQRGSVLLSRFPSSWPRPSLLASDSRLADRTLLALDLRPRLSNEPLPRPASPVRRLLAARRAIPYTPERMRGFGRWVGAVFSALLIALTVATRFNRGWRDWVWFVLAPVGFPLAIRGVRA